MLEAVCASCGEGKPPAAGMKAGGNKGRLAGGDESGTGSGNKAGDGSVEGSVEGSREEEGEGSRLEPEGEELANGTWIDGDVRIGEPAGPNPPVGRGCPARLAENGADVADLCTLEAKGRNGGAPHPPAATDGNGCLWASACGSWAYGSRTAWWAAAAAGAIDICAIALSDVAIGGGWGKGSSASLELLERRLVRAADRSHGAAPPPIPPPMAARPPPPMPAAALLTGGKSARRIAAAGEAAAGAIDAAAGPGASGASDPPAVPPGKGRSSASRITARCCASRTSPCMNRQRGP